MTRTLRPLGLAVAFVFCLGLAQAEASGPRLVMVQMQSPLLDGFRHAQTFLHAQILLPESYDVAPTKRYPALYVIHSLEEDYRFSPEKLASWQDALRHADLEMIVVALDASLANGHHEFADSANNGPWGAALTRELIPELEKQFRINATRDARFVTGHSSGGWSALWLQVNYPDEFGGAWSIAPDPVDFHDFTGPDLTRAPPQNFYRDPRGNPYGFVRRRGVDVTTLREFAQGDLGRAQFDSFDAVFSPRGEDGRPARLFDRRSGVIDGVVAGYWEEHYDLARLIAGRWKELGPKLQGRVHVVVGTEDTYHLEGSLKLFKAVLDGLGSDAEIVFAPGYDHMTIFRYDRGLLRHNLDQMKQQLQREHIL